MLRSLEVLAVPTVLASTLLASSSYQVPFGASDIFNFQLCLHLRLLISSARQTSLHSACAVAVPLVDRRPCLRVSSPRQLPESALSVAGILSLLSNLGQRSRGPTAPSLWTLNTLGKLGSAERPLFWSFEHLSSPPTLDYLRLQRPKLANFTGIRTFTTTTRALNCLACIQSCRVIARIPAHFVSLAWPSVVNATTTNVATSILQTSRDTSGINLW